MRIFVCIKQVPATNKVAVDEKTGVLLRNGVASKMNPYDLYALEIALRLRINPGDTVTVGTMGPPQAQAIVREAYRMGADDGYVFSDRRLGGADVLATSYTLAQAIRSIGDFDMILCGKQTTDGDTAQVGPAIAETLGIPHAAWVSRLSVRDDGLDVVQQLQDNVEVAHMPFPCLVTVEQDICTPRLPSLKTGLAVADKPIHIIGLDDFLDTDAEHYGLAGSATQVERIFAPENDAPRECWQGTDSLERLYTHLHQRKFI